ncbi:putative citrate synthase 2 [Blattella germanica]|nr:putative citrate synthase 2 [Blattella germanica]
MREKISKHREKVIKFRKEHLKSKVGDATIGTIYGGMRGLPGLLCETSYLDPIEGIRYRGYSIPEVLSKLPKSGKIPFPEGIFWLFCTGDIPSQEQVDFVKDQWNCRGKLPKYIIELICNLPKDVHPMAQLSAALCALSKDSQFAKDLNEVKKDCLWELMYEDCMDLLAKITSVAALIFAHTYRDEITEIEINDECCWTTNYCQNMGFDEEKFIEFIKLYLILCSDHEGGNVSAHTVHLVGSALSDAYISMAAGINGLAGPLHGLAAQEVFKFIMELVEKIGESPSDDQVKSFCEEKLKSGVIPGYGHAVLRKTDPRFIAQKEFSEEYLADDPKIKIVWQLFKIVPPLLEGLGKVQNPWPNVDSHTGVVLQALGMCEMNYYTVIFGVSRSIGTMAWLIWSRALLLPIERPKSYTTDKLIEMVSKKK